MRPQPKQETKAILFTNYTDEDFTGYWDSVPYPIKAGQSVMFEDWKARHFAKHLIDRELNKLNRPTNDPARMQFIKKCLPDDIGITTPDQSSMDSELLNNRPIRRDVERMPVTKEFKEIEKAIPEVAPEASFEGIQDSLNETTV